MIPKINSSYVFSKSKYFSPIYTIYSHPGELCKPVLKWRASLWFPTSCNHLFPYHNNNTNPLWSSSPQSKKIISVATETGKKGKTKIPDWIWTLNLFLRGSFLDCTYDTAPPTAQHYLANLWRIVQQFLGIKAVLVFDEIVSQAAVGEIFHDQPQVPSSCTKKTSWVRYLRGEIWRVSRGVEASPLVAFQRKSGFICFVGMVIDALGSKCGICKDVIMYNKICPGGDIKSRNTCRRDKLVRNVCSVTGVKKKHRTPPRSQLRIKINQASLLIYLQMPTKKRDTIMLLSFALGIKSV